MTSNELLFQFAGVGLLGLGPGVEFEDRAVMGVRCDQEHLGETSFLSASRIRCMDSRCGARPRSRLTRAIFASPTFRTERRAERIEHAHARLIVPCRIAPHGKAGGRSDVSDGRPRFEPRRYNRAAEHPQDNRGDPERTHGTPRAASSEHR